jgi:hypothetical protein
MRILIACEESGIVREAFRKLGHDAMSCDLIESAQPGPHCVGDVLKIIDDDWDMMIAHPPCTDLAVSGAGYFAAKRADGRQQRSIEFFMALANARIPKIAVENPICIMSRLYRKPDQIIQPWQFGHDASKATCLWLKGLPLLIPTQIVPPQHWELASSCIQSDATYRTIGGYKFVTLGKPAPRPLWSNQTPSGQNKLGPSPNRAKMRSRTYQGIADAMAAQWGN